MYTNLKIMKKYLIIKFLLILVIPSFAQQQQVPYTLADRGRLIQVEANVNGLRNEMNSLRNEMNSLRNDMNAKFEMVNAKIDYIFWLIGVLVTLMFFMLGFMIWDRREVH